MNVLKLFIYSVIINNFVAFACMASSDVNYCDFSLTLTSTQVDDICNNLPFLSPFNDSRTNLILLLDSDKAQQATLTALTSPQNKAPYLVNAIRNNIATVPFEVTVYGAYLDDLSNTQQLTQNQLENKLDYATKNFISRVKLLYQNTPSLINNQPTADDLSLTPAALAFFSELVKAKHLTTQEQLSLGLARYLLLVNSKADISNYLPSDPSFSAKHFSNYLLGASAFYQANYPLANNYFIEASQAAQPWVKETATYMLARNFLNQAQAVAYNSWGELALNKVDQSAITNSRIAFNNYLTLYPKGLYAKSSTALLRRVYWLQNNKTALANAYENLLESPERYVNNNTSIKHSVADLILEIDNKIYFNDTPIKARDLIQTPKLLLTYDLLKLRLNQLTLANIKAQKVDFKHTPELYNYLLASYYTYIKADPQQVLTLLPELTLDDTELSSFAFSQQVLRALALEATAQWDKAEALWLTLMAQAKQTYQPQLTELGLALHYEKTNQLAKVFANNSPITTPQLRYILLRQNTDRKQLKQLITSRTTTPNDKAYILYLLLYKDLLTGQYQHFLTDSALLVSADIDNVKLFAISKLGNLNLQLFANAIPSHSNYSCPSPIILATVLKLNPHDGKALNCLGEFREHYQLPFANYIPKSSLNHQATIGALGTNKPTSFGANLYSRLMGYQQVFNDEANADEDRAYALFKAIRCFSGTGENRCDKQIIPKAERQKWFRLLHTRYSTTPWAKQQTIYW